MASNRIVRFIVSEDQFNKLKINASLKGHKTISEYLRNLAFNKELAFEKMIIEMHREVMQNGRTKTEARDS